MTRQATPGPSIGIDLGATHIRAAIIDTAGTTTAAIHRKLPDDIPGRRLAATAIATELLRAHPNDRIESIGLAVAGTVTAGVLTWSANLCLDGINYQSELHAATGCPVVVINDARAAALAESQLGAGSGMTTGTVFVVTVGTGIGGGIVIDGQLRTGTGHGGEIGHIPLDPKGPPCRCGQRGCWERLSGGTALNAAAAREAAVNPRGATGRTVAGGQPGAAALAHAAATGDRRAQYIIHHHAHLFARGLDVLCAVIAPHLLVLGGGIIARPGAIRDAYLSAADTLHWHRGQTRTAMLDDNAGMIGAVLAARNSMPSL
ncbi:MAG: glucokinase [Micromonosporaceae bacterium]